LLVGNEHIVFDTINKTIKAVNIDNPERMLSYKFDETGLIDEINTFDIEYNNIFRFEYSERSSSIPHPLFTAYHSIFGNILWSYLYEDVSNWLYFHTEYAGNINNGAIYSRSDRNFFLADEEYISYTTEMDGNLIKSIQKKSEEVN
jgi:hypothetical protein